MNAHVALILGLAVVIATIGAGCTGSAPPAPVVTPTPTQVPVVTAMPTTVPAILAGAHPLGEPVSFGTDRRTGTATVYRYYVEPEYTWTSPTFNSLRQQSQAVSSSGTQYGYNTKTPKTGNVFLFVFIRLEGTGQDAVWSPSPDQYTINSAGTEYRYLPVDGPDVIIGGVNARQLDHLFGNGGTGGYVQPGGSNAADGFFIYEVPAVFDPAQTYLVANLDGQTQAAWNLGMRSRTG